MTYKELMSLQPNVRSQLVSIMEKEKLSIDKLSQLMDVSSTTLVRFIIHEKDLRFATFCKVKKFCEEFAT
jgi:hypothetical protein